MITGISMYRLISGSLLGLLGLSIVFAALGLVGYSPIGIAVTAALAIATTTVASVMAANTMKSIAHLESSVITGLLIAFIVPPTLETRDLLGVSIAGALAGFSKYFVVYRARHFLNPAATGVTIASLLGLTASFWWVANPPMTPFLIAAGLLIAWRSGTLPIALTGLGVGFGLLLVRLVGSGEEPGMSAYLVLTSYPVVFLALFMLTEPLTLPARGWARLLVAVVVGVGVAVPWSVSIGGFNLYSSPELALVLGNLVAFGLVLASRATRSTDATVHGMERFGTRGLVVHFALKRPLVFQAGQWVEFHMPHGSADRRGQRRIFSVVSSPSHASAESPMISIATTLAEPGSSFKQALVHAPEGSAARITTVGGDFLLPRNTSARLAFIAGGIGITPFISQLSQLVEEGQHRDIVLIEVRSKDMAHPFDTIIKRASVRHIQIERSELEQTLLQEDLELGARECFVSGSPAFLRTVKKLLRRKGVRRVHTDSFIGY